MSSYTAQIIMVKKGLKKNTKKKSLKEFLEWGIYINTVQYVT